MHARIESYRQTLAKRLTVNRQHNFVFAGHGEWARRLIGGRPTGYRVIGQSWTATSVTTIITTLVATYAPAFAVTSLIATRVICDTLGCLVRSGHLPRTS